MTKDHLLKRAFIIAEHIKNKQFSPYTLQSKLELGGSYSDFFVCRPSLYENVFIAENIFSLLLDQQFPVNNLFTFYDAQGQIFHETRIKTLDPFLRFTFPSLDTLDEYVSFTHHVYIDGCNLTTLQAEIAAIISQSRGIQHRGYVLYKCDDSSIGSLVHGNFGGIKYNSQRLRPSAKQRRKNYEFTSSYTYSGNHTYHLVFNNPTDQILSIDVIDRLDNSLIEKVTLNSFGTQCVEITQYNGSVTTISKLPICRPIVFKNPYKIGDFDVFHA